jgi:hypothetical protein
MALEDSYLSAGTVSVANGGTTYTFTGVGLITEGVRGGDKFIKNGLTIIFTDDPSTETTITGEPWPGTALSGDTYAIEYLADGSRLSASTQRLVALLGDSGNLDALGGLTGAADQLAYFTGPGALALASLPANARKLLASSAKSGAQLVNAALKASVGGNALTVELKQADGATDCTASLPALIGFRSSTLTSGALEQRVVSGALALTVPSGATLGQSSGAAAKVYVYAIDNTGTVELAVAGYDAGDSGRISTTVLNTSSDASNVMYSTTARSNVAFRKLGVLTNTQATAGTWATSPSEVAWGTPAQEFDALLAAIAALTTAAGKFPRFSGVDTVVAQDIVGTVSQSGGTPTGAIVERGSGANGEYVKYADGTMICTLTDTTSPNSNTALGNIFQSSAVRTWTFPATFAANPVVSVTVQNAARWGTASTISTTAMTYSHFSATTSASTTQVTFLTAIGRWF